MTEKEAKRKNAMRWTMRLNKFRTISEVRARNKAERKNDQDFLAALCGRKPKSL